MKLLQSLYVFVVIALGFVLFGSFASQTYYAGQQRDILHYKAQTASMRALPPIEKFIGPAGWDANGDKTIPPTVSEFWNAPGRYLAALVSGLPLPLRVATLLMILSLLLALLLWPKLQVVSTVRHNFDSLFVMTVAYVVAIFGYVFTWIDYNNLVAETNSTPRFDVFSEGDGITLCENAVSRISVGILITSFSVLLVCRVMADVVRTYQRWREAAEIARPFWKPVFPNSAMVARIPATQPRRYRRQPGGGRYVGR